MAPDGIDRPRPRYVTTDLGQIRLWIAGQGANLVVLPGLIRSAQTVAELLCAANPGWRVIAVELPGIGYSSGVAPESIGTVADTVAEALSWLEDEPCVVLSFDLAGPISERLGAKASLNARCSLNTDSEVAVAWKRAGITPPDLSPRQDGTHLTALWSFIRDRHLLVPDVPSMPAADGAPVPSIDVLSDIFTCAAQRPDRYSAVWRNCLEALPVNSTQTQICIAENDVATRLSAYELPAGNTMPPEAAPLPGGVIWHDYIETGRGLLHLRRAGNVGDPLLVIPTGGGSSAQFKPVIAGLSSGRQVFAVDYPGNGLSDPPEGKVTTVTLAHDMIALLDAMGLEQIDVWGSHTGSLVALEMAILAPERVRCIVMEGPVFIAPYFQEDLLSNYFIDFAPDKWGLHLQAIWNWRRDMFMYWPWYNVERTAARQLGIPDANELHMYALGIIESGVTYDRAYRSAFSYDTRARLPELTRPALICAGPNDQLKNGLTEARAVAPPGLVSYCETPTTVWWPDPDPAEARETLALYDEFFRKAAEPSAVRSDENKADQRTRLGS